MNNQPFVMKAVLALMLLLSSTTSAVARDGEVFFRNKGRVQVGPGAQIEVVDCEPSADNQGNATGGLTCNIKVVDPGATPYRVEQE